MKKSPRTILVTGAAGFIGGNFVREFHKQFPKTVVVGVDDFSSGRIGEKTKGVVMVRGSITERRFLESVFKKYRPEYVFHFAAIPRVTLSVEEPKWTVRQGLVKTIEWFEKRMVPLQK